MTLRMNIELLLQAVDFVEKRDRDRTESLELEHGYASTLPMPQSRHSSDHSRAQRTRKAKSKLHNNRTTHNELEKNRRAHLRFCLETLKRKVPLGADGTRHTTLGLLMRAKDYIKNLEEKERRDDAQREALGKELCFLKRRVEHLQNSRDFASKRRSVSESSVLSTESSSSIESSSSDSSATSGSPISESDEMDILEYGSNNSDSDDHSSVQSSSSDGGVTIFTRRLTLGDPSPMNHAYQIQVPAL